MKTKKNSKKIQPKKLSKTVKKTTAPKIKKQIKKVVEKKKIVKKDSKIKKVLKPIIEKKRVQKKLPKQQFQLLKIILKKPQIKSKKRAKKLIICQRKNSPNQSLTTIQSIIMSFTHRTVSEKLLISKQQR